MNEKSSYIISLLKAQSYECADSAIDDLIASESPNQVYWELRGQSLSLQGKYAKAVGVYLLLLEGQPLNISYLRLLCFAAFKCGMKSLAFASISKAISLDPANIVLYKDKIALQESAFKEYKNSLIIDCGRNSDHLLPLNVANEVLILCGGEASRWKSHLGVKQKHLIPVENEILLTRTLGQVLKYSPKKVTVLVKPGEESIFKPYCQKGVGIETISAPVDFETPAWKYLSSENFWNRKGATISLLGDVWFTDIAIQQIFNENSENWLAFGRSSPSELTGCPYGEIFAHKFTNVEKHTRSLKLLDKLYRLKLCNANASGWALSQIISNEDPNIQTVGKNFVEINDFTDDFDFPEDYERWIANRRLFALSLNKSHF